MAENLHNMELTQELDTNDWRWRINMGANTVAVASEGYANEKDCLQAMFGLFFGTWDESFLAMYTKWQSYQGAQYDVPPEAQEGVPVNIQFKDPINMKLTTTPPKDADAPNYEVDTPTEKGVIDDEPRHTDADKQFSGEIAPE